MPKSNGMWGCTQCSKAFYTLDGLAEHKLIAHPDTAQSNSAEKFTSSKKHLIAHPNKFAAALEKAMYELNQPLKTSLYKANDLAGPIVAKEEPMATKTLDHIDLGKAKKQRDILRKRYREDIQKFRDKFPGLSSFEVAHAIMDTVLADIDGTAQSIGGKPSMAHGLAQTLLPGTKTLIGEFTAEPDEAPDPSKYSYSSTLSLDDLVWAGPKKDVDVVAADTDMTSMWHVSYGWKTHKAAADNVSSFGGAETLYAFGKAWMSGTNPANPGGKSATVFTIWSMKKSAPYIMASTITTYKIKAPKGYKWRKLKNKPIYKAIPIKKSGPTGTLTPASESKTISCYTTDNSEANFKVGALYSGSMAKAYYKTPYNYTWACTNAAKDLWALVPINSAL